MSSTQFKLIQTGPGALTRRVTFAEQPTWFTLASRIESLYNIPIQDVGVSYIDSDGDEITLSTHEELRDYYATVPRIHNAALKFVVKNLGSFRAQQQQQPQSSPPAGNLFDVDDEDWQGLEVPNFPRGVVPDYPRGVAAIFERSPPPPPPPPPPKSPSSAFVETVDSASLAEQAAAAASRSETSGTASPQIVVLGRVFIESDEKGKAREELRAPVEVEDDTSSIVSVIQSDTPVKEPIHVYEFDTEEGYAREVPRYRSRSRSRSYSRSRSRSRSPPRSRSRSPPRSRFPPRSRSRSRSRSSPRPPRALPRPGYMYPNRSRTPSPIRLTPPFRIRPSSPPIEFCRIGVDEYSPRRGPSVVIARTPSDPPSPVLEPIPDPPLPTTEPTVPQGSSIGGASPSLSNDVAGLLNSLTSAFAAHPELSEGLKNIVRNASQGAYWAAERDAMVNDALRATQAAQDVAAHVAQEAQEEAGRKVAEALGGVFRALGGIVGSSVSSTINLSSEHPTNERYPSPEPRVRPVSPQIILPPDHSPVFSPIHPPHSPYSPPPGPPPPMHPPPPGPPPHHRSPRYHRHSPPPRHSPPWRHHHPGPPPPGAHIPPPPPPPPHHPRPTSPPGHHQRRGPPPHGPPPHGPPPHGPPPHSGHPFFGAFGPPVFPPMWGQPPHGGHQLRRSSTLPNRFLGGLRGPDAYIGAPLPPPPPPPRSGSISSNARKVQLEEAKQYYKEKKDEWRKEKEQRKKEKDRREAEKAERIRQRERLRVPIRQPDVYSSEDEIPTIITSSTPQGGVNASAESRPPLPPLDGPFLGWPSMERHAQIYEDSDLQKKRLMRRLADMGFTPRTHAQLDSLVAKYRGKNNKDDDIIHKVLEDVLVSPVPEASGSGINVGGTRPSPGIPGAWKM